MRLMAEGLARDFRQAVRTLSRARGFSIAVLTSLSLGFTLIASTAAVVSAYLVQPLPYSGGDRLFHVRYAPPGPWEPRGMSSLDWRLVEDVVAFPITATTVTFHLAEGGYAQSIRGLRVNRGFLEGLGVRAAFGRALTADDFAATDEQPALLGHALWRERYGADAGIIGRVIQADADSARPTTERFRVVGVLPPEFYFGGESSQRVDVLVPARTSARTYMVKLREGVPPATAQAALTALVGSVSPDLPGDWTGVHLESARERYVGALRPVLLGIFGASVLVLAIVCANVAVLMLLRGMRRQKELAIRASLGCGRLQLARMLLTESAVLCAAAVLIALLTSRILLDSIAPVIEAQLGRSAPGGAGSIAVDGMLMLLLGGTAALVALLLSLLPLIGLSNNPGAAAIRLESGTSAGRRPARHLRSGLIAVQVAGTLVLLVSCGLFLRSALRMVQTDLGFEAEGLVRARIVLRSADYADAAAFSAFYRRFADQLSSVTGAPVVFTDWPPFAEFPKQSVEAVTSGGPLVNAGAITVGPEYFTTFGVRLRAGRDLTEQDTRGEPVAVVSETLARTLWPNGGALGRQIRTVQPTPAGPRAGPVRAIVGIAADVRQGYSDSEVSDVYVPFAPAPPGRFGFFFVRTDQSPPLLLQTIRGVAAELDPHAVVGMPRALVSENRQRAGATFLSMLLTTVAAIAGLLATLGIYGVTAYAVQQREREIAIRIALGAARRGVVGSIMRQTLVVITVGLLAGAAAAGAATRLIAHQLHGVGALDPLTIGAATIVLASAAVVATWLPARRAARCNPVTILKGGA